MTKNGCTLGPSTQNSSTGFPPIAASNARILILGSLPGQRSLQQAQYYAHPQNAFWKIMAALFGIEGDYDHRCRQLVANRIALWDVLEKSDRPGSMDANIRMDTATANDFPAFFASHQRVERVGFNGRKAEALFHRLVLPTLADNAPELVLLPSTSPAYASLTFDEKLTAWRSMLGE